MGSACGRACAALVCGAGLAWLTPPAWAQEAPQAQGLSPSPSPSQPIEQERVPSNPTPSFSELEAAGATIGEISVISADVFDLDDPNENNALFRLANRLHIPTRTGASGCSAVEL